MVKLATSSLAMSPMVMIHGVWMTESLGGMSGCGGCTLGKPSGSESSENSCRYF